MKLTFAACLIVVLAVGCVGKQQLTREESLKMRANYDQIRSKTYQGTTKDQVLDAVHKLFTLADKDYEVSHGQNGCIAYRNWSVYFVLGFVMGKDYWYIEADQQSDATKVTIREITEMITATGTPTGGGGAQVTTFGSMLNPDIIDRQEMENRGAMYYVFFNRLDYLLNQSDEWMDCEKAKNDRLELGLSGNIEPFCLVATDRKPDGIK